MVHAGRRPRHRDPVLPGASAPGEARARADAGSRGRRSGGVPAASCATRRDTRSTTPTQLRRRPTRRRLFGNPATQYPEYYTPKPYSKSFVQHLDHWYAQSHPDEDFAETFAVWLDPHVDVGDALRRLAGAAEAGIHGSADARAGAPAPRVRSTARGRSAAAAAEDARRALPRRSASTTASTIPISTTATCATCSPTRRSTPRTRRRRASCGRIRRRCAARVASFTDSYQYTIDQLLEKIIERCRELNLRLTDDEEATKIDFMVFLTVQTMNYLHSGRHRVAL